MLSLKPETTALLDDIESRIDPETEDDFADPARHKRSMHTKRTLCKRDPPNKN